MIGISPGTGFDLLEQFWTVRRNPAPLQKYHELMSLLCRASNPVCPRVGSLDSRACAPLMNASHPAAAASLLHQPVTCGEEDLLAGCTGKKETLTPQVEVFGVMEQCGPASLF